MKPPRHVVDRVLGIPPPVFTVDSYDSESDVDWKVFVRHAPHLSSEWLADFRHEVDAKVFQAIKTDGYKTLDTFPHAL